MKSNPGKRKPLKGKSGKTPDKEDGGALENKSSLQRKQTKHLKFLTKLEDGRRTLSASKTLVKKKRKRIREKAAKVLDSLSCLADSLPSQGEIIASAQNSHKKVLQKNSHQQVVAKETKQLAAVLAHPEFQTNPFLAIQKHLTNTIPGVELLPQEQTQGKKKKTNSGKKTKSGKRTSVQRMDE